MRGVILNGKPRQILIVEDEGMLRMNIAEEFRCAGWWVLEAGTAEDAIEFVRAGRHVDIIFTDIQLAGYLNGWDVGEQCRNVLTDVAVIYTSGNAANRSRQVDGSLFFDKPYRVEAVIDACDKLT
jgi:two-component system, response regulator PdtaR